jgi:hypothetical protein
MALVRFCASALFDIGHMAPNARKIASEAAEDAA